MRSALDPLDALVSSLVGTTGVLPCVVMTLTPIETSDRLSLDNRTPLDRLVPPDSPPPRA
jgi:hypothetical protein